MSSCACMYSFFVGIFRIDFYFDGQNVGLFYNVATGKSNYLKLHYGKVRVEI